MNSPSPEALRKVAVLVGSLDAATAEALLDQMDATLARQVRIYADGLEQVEEAERSAAIAEFLRRGSDPDGVSSRQACDDAAGGSTAGVDYQFDSGVDDGGAEDAAELAGGISLDRGVELSGGIELDGDLAELWPSPADASTARSAGRTDEHDESQGRRWTEPFAFLYTVDTPLLRRLLEGQPAQIVALVVAHLPREQACRVLDALHPTRRRDVQQRVHRLGDMDPLLLEELERELRTRLNAENERIARRKPENSAPTAPAISPRSEVHNDNKCDQHVAPRRERAAGLHSDVAGTMPSPRQCGERFAATPEMPDFEQLHQLDNHDLAVLLEAADPELALLGLAACDPPLAERILRPLPSRRAHAIRLQLTRLGPLRMSDLDEARRRLVRLAVRLADEGRLQWSPHVPATGRETRTQEGREDHGWHH